jgi:hypothetical protein
LRVTSASEDDLVLLYVYQKDLALSIDGYLSLRLKEELKC